MQQITDKIRALRWGWACLLAMLAVAAGLAAVQAQQPAPPFDPAAIPAPDGPPLTLLGEALYQENCAPCHGPEGGGDGPTAAQLPVEPAPFASYESIWARSPAELFHVTKFGRIENLMPPWGNQLTDEQIWQAVYYAWSLHTSAEMVAEGAELYAESCAACHGAGGAGDGPESSGDLADFTDQEAMIAVSQADLAAGWAEAHPAIGEGWTEAQQRAVLEYIRTFNYQPPWEALAAGPGVIRGQVVQQTPDAPAFPGGTVTLEVYAHMTPLTTREAETDADGRFVFEDLPVDPGLFYLVSTQYQDVRYSTPVLRFPAEEEAAGAAAELEATLPVYGTTDDPAEIVISRMSWIVEHEPGALLIGQVLSFGNNGERTYTGETVPGVEVPVTVAIPLPPAAEDVGFQDGALGGVYRQVDGIVRDTRPVPPGEATRQLFVRYRLPYAGTATTIEQPLLYPVAGLTLLVSELPGLALSPVALEGDLAAAGEQAIQGLTYQQWTASTLPPQTLALRLEGLLAAGAEDPRAAIRSGAEAALPAASPALATPLAPSVPLALGGVMAALLAGVLVWRWRWGAAQTTMGGPSLDERRAELIQRVAHLDDLHALGELDERQWQTRRSALKRELLAVASQQETPR